MTENQWWSTKIKPMWHNPSRRWVARKVQDLVNKGAPDVDACFNGTAVKIELKWCQTLFKDQDHVYTFSTYAKKKNDPDFEKPRGSIVSREQYRNLEEWHNAGGHAMVLIGIAGRWWLLRFPQVNNQGMTGAQLYQACELYGELKDIRGVAEYFADGDYVR